MCENWTWKYPAWLSTNTVMDDKSLGPGITELRLQNYTRACKTTSSECNLLTSNSGEYERELLMVGFEPRTAGEKQANGFVVWTTGNESLQSMQNSNWNGHFDHWVVAVVAVVAVVTVAVVVVAVVAVRCNKFRNLAKDREINLGIFWLEPEADLCIIIVVVVVVVVDSRRSSSTERKNLKFLLRDGHFIGPAKHLILGWLGRSVLYKLSVLLAAWRLTGYRIFKIPILIVALGVIETIVLSHNWKMNKYKIVLRAELLHPFERALRVPCRERE